jgi:hypothetical protein
MEEKEVLADVQDENAVPGPPERWQGHYLEYRRYGFNYIKTGQMVNHGRELSEQYSKMINISKFN